MILLQIPDTPTLLPDSVATPHQELSMLANLPVDELLAKLVNGAVTFAINMAIAIIVFYAGRFLINKLYKFVSSIFERRQLDRSLTTFVLSMVRIVLYFILIVTVIGILGIETSSFIAIFASAGVAIGMALSGTLQNFAGGVLILLLKPYKVGDYIEAQGYAGTVREIAIFHTIISTPDNKIIIIPNGGLSTGSINNYSTMDYRRVDWIVGISYGDDVNAARTKILEIVSGDPDIVKKYIEVDRSERNFRNINVLKNAPETIPEDNSQGFFSRIFGKAKSIKKEKEVEKLNRIKEQAAEAIAEVTADTSKYSDCSPKVVVAELAASSINLKVMAWTRNSCYWDVYYRINENIYKNLGSAGVSFPFPQLDVHVKPSQPVKP